MIDAHSHEAGIGADIVYAIGNGFAGGVAGEVVDVHQLGLALRFPLASPFLTLPINSFFFVSTEITGTPRSMESFALALMCSNCALGSGCCAPSTDSFGDCKL